ncbi:SCP2 sterol-binding domain-containing protein [Aquihabitans sp. G128]|uniref:SCP2 sterol-binding domain-containing protein n=1 Tax=Aquihabitans sp. G128 TaxID=2849779 RepID=UPI001C223059|nr:SCP2 sterol-binding domain-containing protein [Aquihabitans sp. G128]QXC61449.1 SCP2 sterol-binding domain-containing protein [Aquihabitans sp. G128]
MAAYLSQEWLDALVAAATDLPEVPGLDARIQFVVPGGPDGELKVAAVVTDGRVAAGTLGADDDADLTLTITYKESMQLATGDLDPNAAFMRGRIKVAGSTGTLLRLLAATKDPAWAAARDQLEAATDR